ncbi:Pescadillo N-terminus-domain-containing protein [Suillus lakei]|nr:Pescadillo N-terminus-domain-containing protein [Suillus lakei]
MGRLKQKGKAGAAKAYVTRSSAVKKLQCSLADFRRLCILKGIFPREPRHRKRANKGSTAPTSFYYAKDIAYLAHEPVLNKLREHKAFAKKISRALGRGRRGMLRRDHERHWLIKFRYPSFVDAVRDIDDALCMVFLFASLPSSPRVSPALIENCARLTAEWQLYVMHTRSLRNVFLSIKGVYYQAEVMDQNVTWLVPYQFPQNIPSDVDVRVMLTFLELYQTLLGFVFFKLYTDAGLVYPPPLDSGKDESGAANPNPATGALKGDASKVSSKEVRQTIKNITAESSSVPPADVDIDRTDSFPNAAEEEFVPQTSKSDLDVPSSLPTLLSLSSLPILSSTNIFAPYTFWLSRETSRSIFEFLIRSFGGRIGWPVSSGGGSPYAEDDEAITHVIIDRPAAKGDTAQERERRRRRKYVQPQWVVDCINAGKILLEDLYAQGKTLPPHLSPFGERDGAYDPTIGLANVENSLIDNAELSEDSQEAEDCATSMAALAVAAADDPEALRAAELAAEAAGIDFGAFEKEVQKKQKQQKQKEDAVVDRGGEEDMNKILMSKRKRQLYERMKYGEKKRATEHAKLEEKRTKIEKDRRRKARAS